MKKSIFLFFAAILCATSALAGPSFKGGCVYFHNKGGWNDTYKYICISHDSWTEPRAVTVITNTQLWYNALPSSGWTDAKYMSAMGHSSRKSASNFKVSSCNHYTANVSLGDWGFNSGNAQMLTPASGSNNAKLTLTYVGNSYTSMNKTITVKAKVSTNDGATYSEATSPGTLSASSYAFTSYTSCKSAKSLSSGKITCGYTANTTLTAADADGYTFDGWYDAAGTKQTADKTLSINPTADATYYAYYTREALAEETHDVTISYVCGSTSIKENKTETGVGVSTPSEISAPAIDGYKFDSWSFGTGVQSTDAETANPIDITTKTSGIYTLTANYSELPKETVYFINTPKWTGTINAYAWTDGTPKVENAGWAGLPAKKEDFQIGEYEVYSYTAKQGQYANVIFNGTGGQTTDLTWQAGKYYAPSKDKWYDDAAAAESALAIPLADETVYFVNNKKWANVAIYGWGGTASTSEGIGKWAGADMTKTAEQVAGFDVYSYTAKEGTVKNILFNYNGDENKTSNFVWTDGKYYYMGAAENYAGGTKEEVAVLVAPDPLATEVYLAGDMTNKDNWDVNKKEFKKATAEATTASVTVTLAAQTYKFKLVVGGAWKGNTGTMTRGGESVHEGGWQFDADGYDDNCQIVADIAGDYTFTWNLTDKKLTVAYPPLPKHQVTATVNPAESGTVTGTGEYEQGSEATLIATPAAGYTFKNWTVAGTEKSVEATYKFAVTEAVELVANFVTEETHEVTISYLCNGTPIPGQAETKLAVGITTPSTISAPAITNYKFDSWKVGSGVQAVDATKDPIQITTLATGDYTLAANYTKIELTYNVTVPAGTPACYIAGKMNSWTLTEMTKVDDTHYTITIDGATTAHKYKYACGDSWDYVELKADGSSVDDRTYNANDVVAKWAEPAKCYLMGNGDWDNGVEMEEDGTQFKLLAHHIYAPFKFKYGEEWSDQVENYDFPGIDWKDGNIVLPEGIYDFYFNKTTKKVRIVEAGYTRNVTNKYGTICLPYASASTSGAYFYKVAGKETGKVYLESVDALEAGVPYIFEKTANQIKVVYTGEAVDAPQNGDANGLVGTFTNETVVAEGDYILYNNELRPSDGTAKVNANRAYLDMDAVIGGVPQQMPGRRYIGMSVQGENEATGFENITAPEGQVLKTIVNGQLVIIRGGEMFNAMGVKL